MSYRLSLLDKSPVAPGEGAEAALARTVALARRAEQLGYHRYWVAEHHAAPGLAGAAPEALVAFLLASTSRIRIGSGGVMLQHYSPYKVAETFNVLAALAPGRVDLGVGKAPGGLPLSTRALQWGRAPVAESFAAQISLLDGLLHDRLPADHPLAGVEVTPKPSAASRAGGFLLGASVESAELAAGLGWDFVYAGHFNGDPVSLARTFEAYARASNNRPPLLALAALAGEDDAAVRAKVAGLRIFRVSLADGRAVNVGSHEQAASYARQAGSDTYTVEERTPGILAGTPERIHAELDALSRRHGIGEFILDIPLAAGADRLATVELLARDAGSRAALAAAA